MGYLTVLFAVAFLLLLLSYFMQHRNSQETIDGLKDSVSAMQSVQEVYEQNGVLRHQVNELEDQLAEAQRALEDLQKRSDSLTADSQLQEALVQDYRNFFRVDRLYRAKMYQEAATLITQMESGGHKASENLSDKPVSTDPNEVTPLARYKQICEQLRTWGYLE